MLKHTKIVATVSDQRCDVAFVEALYKAGMNVVRLNTAHMMEEGLTRVVNNVRTVSDRIGILMDTKNFTFKTGVRTFEAAAYLKRNGADLTKVRKMSRESMETYRIRAKAISEAEILYGRFAIATLVGIGVDSPTVIGAQVANELLDIDGIEASFVLTGVHERVYISARSIDEVNVQKIMEEFGGGGHLTVAGAQLVDVSLEEAKNIIHETLRYLISKGEI